MTKGQLFLFFNAERVAIFGKFSFYDIDGLQLFLILLWFLATIIAWLSANESVGQRDRQPELTIRSTHTRT